jgi:hypothetical protein
MKTFLMMFLILNAGVSLAGPRVVGNGFMKTQERTLTDMEKDYKRAKNESEKFDFLNEMVAKYASESYVLKRADIEKVRTRANLLLRLAKKYAKEERYSKAIHHGNLALGRISLYMKNLKTAERYLWAASKIKGSNEMKASGPNMTLAKDLLKEGSKEAVILFINECSNWWEGEEARTKMNDWKRTIEENGVPDFKDNMEN